MTDLQKWFSPEMLMSRFAIPIGIAVAVFFGSWIAAAVVYRLVGRLGTSRHLDPDLTRLLGRIARIVLLIFGGITALGTFGVDIKALVAGLGLTGFALGFALKDIISNSLAGVLILFYKPFRRGDRIDVAGSAGLVTEIDLRYTILTTENGDRVLVPNSTLFTNSIRVTGRDAMPSSGSPKPAG